MAASSLPFQAATPTPGWRTRASSSVSSPLLPVSSSTAGPTGFCGSCANPVNQVTASLRAGCTAGFPARTTSVRSSNGLAGPWPPGRCPAWPSLSGLSPTWPHAPAPTMSGTTSISLIIPASGVRSSRAYGRRPIMWFGG